MADLTITAANVVAVAGATTSLGTSGATVTAGQAVYVDTADNNKYKLVDNDASGTATVAGISLNGASDGQPISVVTAGNVDIGATLTQGEVYCSSSTAGGVAPDADNLTGDYRSVIGVATSSSNLLLGIINSGVAIP